MTNTKELGCEFGTQPVMATPIPGTECLHAIPNKCIGCKIAYIPEQPRAFEINQSSVFLCKPVEDCYLDEQLAIAVTLGFTQEIINELIDEAHDNETRRARSMLDDYFEPPTLTHLREIGVYPHPKLSEKGESIRETMNRHFNYHKPPKDLP